MLYVFVNSDKKKVFFATYNEYYKNRVTEWLND